MEYAASYIGAFDSESDDYVSMDEEEMGQGVQQLFAANNDSESEEDNEEDAEAEPEEEIQLDLAMLNYRAQGQPPAQPQMQQQYGLNPLAAGARPPPVPASSSSSLSAAKPSAAGGGGTGSFLNFFGFGNGNNNDNANASQEMEESGRESAVQAPPMARRSSLKQKKIARALTSKLKKIKKKNKKRKKKKMMNRSAVADESMDLMGMGNAANNYQGRFRAQQQLRRAAHKKVNANVVSLDLSTLGSKANEVATGDAYFCQNPQCKVVFSKHDILNNSTLNNTTNIAVNNNNNNNNNNNGNDNGNGNGAEIRLITIEEMKISESADPNNNHNHSDAAAVLETDVEVDDDERLWKCQFCQHMNKLDIEDEEAPKSETVDYIVEPASDDLKSEDEKYIIFCIDVSGSMCVTQEITGSYQLRGSQLLSMKSDLSAFGDGSNQFLPNQKQNTTWVSRLQSVQAAIDEQLNVLSKSHPNNKICLVAFANDVTIIGDGSTKSEFIVGDKLLSMEKLKQIGAGYALQQPIHKTKKELSQKVFALQEKGQTALGPALVTSIAIAAQKRGSQVILCTDGLANIGLGSLDAQYELTEAQEQGIGDWYENLGNWALTSGVTVNIISITDSQCQLEYLGKVCDVSQGNLERINPLELTSNFASILSRTCLATNVQAKMLLPPMLQFKNLADEELNPTTVSLSKQRQRSQKQYPTPKPTPKPEPKMQSAVNDSAAIPVIADTEEAANVEESESNASNTNQSNSEQKENDAEPGSAKRAPAAEPSAIISAQTQDIGNVFADTKIFFEYIVDKKALKKPKYKNLENMPFQVQISYTRLDGSKMMRVITQLKPLTKDRQKVMDSLNMNIIGANASRKSAQLAEDGDYEAARAITYSNAMWMATNSRNVQQQQQMSSYVGSNMAFDGMMQQQQAVENKSVRFSSKKSKKMSRKKGRNDGFSKAMYSNKKSRY